MFDVAEAAGRFSLTERQIDRSFTKDYDALPGNAPLSWPQRFQVDDWGLFSARVEGRWVGAAAVAADSSLVPSTDDRASVAVLWDLRVSAAHRGMGVGRALFAAAEIWARAGRCDLLVAETQNINVAACRFYGRQGCRLERIDRAAYPECPDEVKFIWQKRLRACVART